MVETAQCHGVKEIYIRGAVSALRCPRQHAAPHHAPQSTHHDTPAHCDQGAAMVLHKGKKGGLDQVTTTLVAHGMP